MRYIKPFIVADCLVDFSREDHLMALKYIAEHAGKVVMINELLFLPQDKIQLRELILSLLDESDFIRNDENLINYSLDSVREMTLSTRWRRAYSDVDFVMLAKSSTLDAWWSLLSKEEIV
ncbi:hypothetical protein KKJ28_19330 [Xenorhabdus bovienii]|nr:hypothetical protein [Xenorhabdus bovienii]